MIRILYYRRLKNDYIPPCITVHCSVAIISPQDITIVSQTACVSPRPPEVQTLLLTFPHCLSFLHLLLKNTTFKENQSPTGNIISNILYGGLLSLTSLTSLTTGLWILPFTFQHLAKLIWMVRTWDVPVSPEQNQSMTTFYLTNIFYYFM